MRAKTTVLCAAMFLLFAGVASAQGTKTSGTIERSVEVNFNFGTNNASIAGTGFPRASGFGGGVETYLHPHFSTGMELFHQGSAKMDFGGTSVGVSRTYFAASMNIYLLTGKFRPYGTFGQGYGSNRLYVNGAKQSQSAYAMPLGFGFKMDVSEKWAVGAQFRLTFGGRMTDKGLFATVTRRF